MTDDQNLDGGLRGRALIAWVGAPIIGIAFFPTILLLVIGMSPSIVAFLVDQRPRKVTARAVCYLNFAGCLPYAFKLWGGKNSINEVLDIISDPTVLMVMYSFAAIGWILNFFMAPVMLTYLSLRNERKSRSLKNRQEKLIKEWGDEVKGQGSGHQIETNSVEEVSSKEKGNAESDGVSTLEEAEVKENIER